MQKKIDFIFAGVILLLGAFHTVATLAFQRPTDLDFLMYVGTGFAFLMAGILNLPAFKGSNLKVLVLVATTNFVFVVYMVFITIEVSDFRAISVIIAFLWLLVSSITDLKKNSVSNTN